MGHLSFATARNINEFSRLGKTPHAIWLPELYAVAGFDGPSGAQHGIRRLLDQREGPCRDARRARGRGARAVEASLVRPAGFPEGGRLPGSEARAPRHPAAPSAVTATRETGWILDG